MVDQILVLILQAPNDEIRESALGQLLDLARGWDCGTWTDDVVIFEALLDALLVVYGSVEQKQWVSSTLMEMASIQKPALRKAFGDWLGGSSPHQKLESTLLSDAAEPGSLFHEVKESVLEATHPDLSEYDVELRAGYEAPEFAEVTATLP